MKISVIICTLNRAAVLHETVLSVLRQRLLPRQIIITCPSQSHIKPETLALPGVQFVLAPLGLSKQRNRSLDAVAQDTDIIAFFDDDMELCPSYLMEMSRLFAAHPEIILASGRMLHDGGRGARMSRGEAIALCDKHEQAHETATLSYRLVEAGYGCNLMLRYADIGGLRFDERLPLYAFLEDHDFSYRCTVGKHPPVELENALGVHLGWRSGRTSGVRVGFSTIVNPIYLKRKANIFSFPSIFIQYWMRCLVGNVLGLLMGDREYDRFGLLKGNILGFHHLMKGKCDPEYILRL